MSDCKLENPEIREELEGFLGDDFNGVIFLLREPNTDGKEADSFWFKNCLNNTIPKDKNKGEYKGNFEKYRKKFEMMLQYLEPAKELGQAAYFNLRPGSGGPEKTYEYDLHLHSQEYVKNRFHEIIDYCKPKAKDRCIYLFTCCDIANALPKHGIIRCLTKRNGITFKRKEKEYPRDLIQFEYDGLNVYIYAIDHPCCSSHVCEYEKKESNT